MHTWRTLILLALAFLAAYLLYPRPSSAPATNPNAQEITLWVVGQAADPIRTAVEQFERKHEGKYRVIIGNATVRDATGDATRFLLGVAGGSPPDLIHYDRFAVVEAAARGAFRPLNDLLARDANSPNAIKPEHYFTPMWEEPQYQGNQYGIPNSVDVRALIINDDQFERAGFRNPDGSLIPPTSWEDLCLKKSHTIATVAGDLVTPGAPYDIPGVGPSPPKPQPPAPGDLAVLVAGESVYRARITDVTPSGSFRIRSTPADGESSPTPPPAFQGQTQVKVFSKDSYAIRLTRFDENAQLVTVGFSPLYGNSWLYMFGWQNGAVFMSPDGTQCRLNEPAVKEALQFVVDAYDAMGGYKRVKAFEGGFQKGAQDPFLTGKIAMRIDGNWYLDTIAAYRPDIAFTVVPAPIPAARLAAGHKPITWAGGWAYAIPATAKHQEAAWELLQFLVSPEGLRIQSDVSAGLSRGKGKPFIPPLSPDRRVQAENRAAYLANNPQVTRRLLAAYDAYVALVPESKYRPVTPVGQKLWMEHALATEKAAYHNYDVHTALEIGTRHVQTALDRHLNPPQGPTVNWSILIALYVLFVALAAAGIAWAEVRHRRKGHGRRDWRAGFLGISPWLVGFLLLGLGPILFSLIISFCSWDVLSEARFVGLDNYRNLLGFHTDPATGETIASDPEFWKSLRNTAFMMLGVPLGIVLGIAIAMLLNATVKGMAFFRTIYYLPAIVPAVASFLIWIWVFDDQRGIINMALRNIGLDDPPKWLQSQDYAKPALLIMGLWGVGGGMLIWLAGLKNIPAQLYEAAQIDGAGPIRRFLHVTLPMLSPYIFFNTVLGMIGAFQIFEAAYIMTNGGPSDSTLFYAYKLFNEAFRYLNMGTAAAMAWIMFVIVLALTLLNLYLGKKWVHYE